MTDEEFEAKVNRKLQKKYEKEVHAISNFQVKKERAAKLKSMQRYLYGKFLIVIPKINLDLLPDFPLPESFANVHDSKSVPPIKVTERKFGQHLKGDMIPVREIQFTETLGKVEHSPLIQSIAGHVVEETRHLLGDTKASF
jgi:hypothetical protein